MKYIFDENKDLLHIVYRKEDFKLREDIVRPEEFIQVASLKLNKGQTFKPHMHLWKKVKEEMKIAQESWVIIQGSVKVNYYDTDGNPLADEILYAGDCTITLQGGHNYKSLEENTLVYEFKTGPYEGQSKDKIFI
tara:strand:+ start:63 stop:467 length:405 start_codon:yes stop_codon:yes gene_type:complete